MQLQHISLVKTEPLYLFMLCPVHVSSCEQYHILTMAPNTRNKKKNKQIELPTNACDDDYGRSPGTATKPAHDSESSWVTCTSNPSWIPVMALLMDPSLPQL